PSEGITRLRRAGIPWSPSGPGASNNPMAPLLEQVTGIDSRAVAAVLSEVAEIASETLELRDVFPRVAAAVRRVLPFDNMGVVRIVDGERVVLHATTVEHQGCEGCQDCSESASLSAWSPRWRPHSGPMFR